MELNYLRIEMYSVCRSRHDDFHPIDDPQCGWDKQAESLPKRKWRARQAPPGAAKTLHQPRRARAPPNTHHSRPRFPATLKTLWVSHEGSNSRRAMALLERSSRRVAAASGHGTRLAG